MTFTRSKTIPVWIKSLFTILLINTLIAKNIFVLNNIEIGEKSYILSFLMILEISLYITYVLTLFECKINKRTYFSLLIAIIFLLLTLIWDTYYLWLSIKDENWSINFNFSILYSPNILLCFLSFHCLIKYLRYENQKAKMPEPLGSVAPVWVKITYSFIIITGFTVFSQLGLNAFSSVVFTEFRMNMYRELGSFLLIVVFTISIVCAWTSWILTLTNQKISRPLVIVNLIFIAIGTLPVFLLSFGIIFHGIPTLKNFLTYYPISLGPCLTGIISLLCCYLYLRK